MSQTTATPSLAISRQLGGWVSPWHVIVSFAALVGAYWTLQNDAVATLRELASDKAYFASGHQLLFDTQIRGYSLADAQAHLSALGNAACFYYADTYIALYDLVFPLTLAAFVALLVLYTTQPGRWHALDVTPAAQKAMLAVPLAVLVLDMGENLLVSTMLSMQPAISAKVVETASMMTQLKWLAGLVEAVMVSALLAFAAHRMIEGRKPGVHA